MLRTISVSSTTLDTILEIFDADSGASVAYNDDIMTNVTNSSLTFTPQAGHSYVIRVSEFAEGTTGNYSLRVQ